MTRVIKKPGDLFKLSLNQGRHAYAQWLSDGTARFFRAAFTADASIEEILRLPVAFRVCVFRDTPARYGWQRVGHASIPPECKEPQRYAKKDIVTGQLSIYYEGTETAATADELRGLEPVAVWAHPHLVERLEAELCGRESDFLRSIRVLV